MLLKSVITIAVLGLAVYLLGAAVLYSYQRNMLYIPSPEYDHGFDELELRNEQETLKVVILSPGKSRAIIYFGGNAEAVIFNAEPFIKNFPDHTVYLANYRGYGGSTGAPTETGLYSDSIALYDRIRSKHDSVSLLGRSLGSGVATNLASKREIRNLALVTPFDSIENVAQARIPIYPINLLIKDKYDSLEKAAQISAEVLIVMAEFDLVIPNAHSIKLSKAFSKNQVSILNLRNSNHNNVSLNPQYFSTLKRFFDTKP